MIAIIGGLITVAVAFLKIEVMVDHNRLNRSRSMGLSFSGSIPKNELEELVAGTTKLTAVSDRKRLIIPVHSDAEDDLSFVHDTIVYQLGR